MTDVPIADFAALTARVDKVEHEVAEIRTLIGYDPDADQWVTAAEAAHALHVHKSTIYKRGLVTPGRGVHISHLPPTPE